VRSSVETVEPTRVKISVVVEPDELRPAIDRAVRRLSREIRVPGFRKGKVPRQVMEARIGREAIVADAIENEAVPEFYTKALEELDIKPLSRGQVEPPEYTDGGPLEFSATVEVKPEIDLPPYKGVVVVKPEAEVTDAQIDEQLERLRERMAQLEVIERPLKEGDFATVDLRSTHHDEEIPELTRADGLYEIGSGGLPEAVDTELLGKRKGDIVKVNITLPEEAAERAGQDVTMTALVKETKAKVLPELDDDFASEASEFDTVDELKADLRTRLEEAAAQQAAAELESRVLSAYLDTVEMPLPPTLVGEEIQFRASRLSEQLAQLQMPLDRYLEMTNQTTEQLQDDLREQAEKAVKAQLTLEAVAEAEGMAASDEEVDAEIERQAARMGRTVKEVRKALSGSRGEVIRGDILRSKALALMVEQADQSGTAEDTPAAPEDSADAATEE
jgi:trigger factor